MTDSDNRADTSVRRMLLPVIFPDPAPVDPSLMHFLGPVSVTLLGCYVVPEQTAPEQARSQFEDQVRQRLDDLQTDLSQHVSRVDTDLVFTPNAVDTVERVADDHQYDAIIRARPTDSIVRVLALATDSMSYQRFVDCVSALTGPDISEVHVVKFMPEAPDEGKEQLVLEGLHTQLRDHGIPEDILRTERIAAPNSIDPIVDRATSADIALLGACSPEVGDAEPQSLAEQALERLDIPVIVIRHGPG